MQQQTHWHLDPNQQLIHYHSDNILSWDTFPNWAEKLVHTIGGTLVTLSQGADRVQLHFRLEQEDYLCHFESLCEAVWIESQSHNNSSTLVDLYNKLTEDTHVAPKHL